MSNLRKLKDPLYGYVYYSAFEEKIIEHPLVLRLHHIRQNGAAFLTYPSMRVHRFEHSLGAMHVAGLLYKSAIEFSEAGPVDSCLADLINAIDGNSVSQILTDILKASHGKGLGFLTEDRFYTYNCLNEIDNHKIFARLLVFQSLRIAALVHDIGHPPFSHTFESALKQVRRTEYSNHETVGLELLNCIIEDVFHDTDGHWYFFAKAVLKLVSAIIDKANPSHWRVSALNEIVSGDVDADRLDYVRRDTLSSGSSTNTYDLGRLVDAVRFKCNQETNGKSLQLVMTADALSTIEAFFNVRFHLYRWMLWHHNVVRHNLAIILVIKILANLSAQADGEIKRTATEIMAIALDVGRRREYWYFTDFYLLDKLALCMRLLDSATIPAGANGDQLRLLRRYLRTFLYREKHHLRPLWKRPDDYVRFGEHVTGQVAPAEGARDFNKLLRDAYRRFAESAARVSGIDAANAALLAQFMNENVEYLSGAFCDEMETYISNDLVADKVKVRAYYLAKFKPCPTGLVLHNRDGDWTQGYDIGVLSPSISALNQAWEGLPHLWLFVEKLPEAGISLPIEGDPQCPALYGPIGKSMAKYLRPGGGAAMP